MAESTAGRQEIWVEKYRPERLEDVVGHEEIISRIESYVERDDLPHLLFAGPAGVGKCLSGETPVLTDEGILPISDVVGSVDGFGEPETDFDLQTFSKDGSFSHVSPASVFSKVADETTTVRTRDGGSITVTPEHPLLTITESGLEWKAATHLEPGDRIARPHRTASPEANGRIQWYDELDGNRIYVHVDDDFAERQSLPIEENYVGKKRDVIRQLRRGKSVAEIAERIGVARKTISHYDREFDHRSIEEPTTVVSLGYLREHFDYDVLEDHIEAIQYVNATNNRSRPITPPDYLDPEIARFVGLLVSEARIENGRIRFYNTDERLLDSFETTLRERFGLDPDRTSRKGVPFVRVQSQTIVEYLQTMFDVVGDGIASTIVKGDDEARAAFLQAVFDSEAFVTSRSAIELTQKDETVITAISYLLSTFGIPSRRKREMKAATNGSGREREYHTLVISGSRALTTFTDHIGFSMDSKQDRLDSQITVPSNPNHDTIPQQESVGVLCRRLNLEKQSLVGDRDSPTSARDRYLDQLREVTAAARKRLRAANRALEHLEEIEESVYDISKVPSVWVGEREELEPLKTRKELAEPTGSRSDHLLEYADGRRTPRVRRMRSILETFDHTIPDVSDVQQVLLEEKDALGVSFEEIADGTRYRGADINELLRRDDQTVASLPRFEIVVRRLEQVATDMLSVEVLGQLRSLELVSSAELYYDEVLEIERSDTPMKVYDLTVPETHNFVAGSIPTVMHNTATATAIAKELYGEDWQENFLELNASDERGIDVVRDRIKNFARSSFGGFNYRIIFLDEADALTSDAQSALRRTMEQFSNNTRFVLSCNYSSQIIDPIQSRCAVFRFSPLADEDVAGRIRDIADKEGIEYTDDGIDALVYAADGDMRRAINALQAAAATGDRVEEETVYTITSTARPEEIREMVTKALDGDFQGARARLEELITERGLAGGDIIDQIHRSVWDFDIDEEAAVNLMDRVGEADYRITTGANEQVQLEALLASVALQADD